MTSRADGKLPLPPSRSMARAGAVLLFAAAVGFADSALAVRSGGGGEQAAIAAPAQSLQGNHENLADFFDPLFARHLDEHRIPGAVIAVVQSGEIVFRQGYGYADVERGVPVDPDVTLFNIGSVTKLFTATAIMQLVEQGAVDLHADVNKYLTELQVPATFNESVTLHHLLTHTAGFDDRYIGMTAPTLEAVEPLGANLARHLPPRIRPPGQAVQYSNHSIALAGHVVEAVSGMDFADYVGERILRPLEMERTTLGFPPELVPDMATGYGYSGEDPRPQRPNYFNILPAGGMRSTAADMSTFMLAHLGEGEHEGRRKLETATARTMHERQFTAHPAVSGVAYGFFEHVAGDRRGLHHSGDDPEGFATLLYLLPQAELGLFVSYNSAWGAFARIELIEKFLHMFFPVLPFHDEPSTLARQRAPMFAGQYRWNRQDRHSLARLPTVLTTLAITVRPSGDGTLTTSIFPLPFVEDANWVETEPLLFRHVGGAETMAFDVDARGRATHMHIGWPVPITLERLSWYETLGLHMGLLVFFVIAFASSSIGWPAAALVRRLRRRETAATRLMGHSRLTAGLVSGVGLAFLLGFAFYGIVDPLGALSLPLAIRLLLWLPLIGMASTLLLVILVARLWLKRDGRLAGRLHVTLIALAAVIFVPFLYYWRLLGFHF